MDEELKDLLDAISKLIYDWEALHDNTIIGCYLEWPLKGPGVYQWTGEIMRKTEGCTVFLEPLDN